MTRHQHPKPSSPSQRMLRVGELVRHALVEVFAQEGLHDTVLASHTITFPEVRMSADLRLATVYVMPLGGRDTEAVLAALDRNKRWLRGALARRIDMKFMPELRFRIDETFDEADRIERLLRSPAVARDLKSKREASE
jgi:ribosome-binding factor A